MPTVPSSPSKEQRERERIERERQRIQDERNKIIDGMDPDEGGPNPSERERLRKLEEEEDRLNGKPPPAPEDPDEPWSDPEGDTDNSSEHSTSSGPDNSGDSAGGGQEAHSSGPEEMPGSDIVTGKTRAQAPVRRAMPTLQDAVAHRLGGVIDEADAMKQVVADPSLCARLAGAADVVHPGDVHPPVSPDHAFPGRAGDPRTGGAVDPPRKRRRPAALGQPRASRAARSWRYDSAAVVAGRRERTSMEAAADTLQKALRINLDPRWYGTIAEIGAGQEVARWFFRAGGAAGTVAKSMSAYDMAVSDAVYGKSDRYVSMGRLQAMLDREFQLNQDRLGEERGDETAFFAFADTVVARSYQGGNECHGWMGVKFQSHPHDEASQVILHVRMLDAEAALQQEALGVVGVNLLHGAFFLHHEPEILVESLLDRLTTGRIEIDMIQLKGIEFRSVDNRLMALKLVQVGLSGAAMFGPDREVLQPSEVLRKKAILVERGSFRPPTVVNIDMLASAREKFEADPDVAGRSVLVLTELTMANLLAGGGDVDRRDFLARAELLAACGMTVLISDYVDYHRLAAYLAWRTDGRIGIVMGVPSLIDLFNEANHAHLSGGILESFGRLFKNGLRLFVYPMLRDGQVTTVNNVAVGGDLQPLYDYLARRGSFVDLDNYKPDYLPILSRDVLNRIAGGDATWESMVPEEVGDLIKKRGFFGYRRPEQG